MTDMTATQTVKKPFSLMGLEPATDVESYGDVPRYRRQELILFPLLLPIMIVVALTGTIFTKPTKAMRAVSDAAVWRYTAAARAFFVVVGALAIAGLTHAFVA